MQTGGYDQRGGFIDPGLAALIAALLSGGIGGYGYSKDSRSATDAAAERLRGEYEQKLANATEKQGQFVTLEMTKREKEQELARVTSERDALRKENETLKSKIGTDSASGITFQNASAAALTAAIDPTLAGLKSTYGEKYPWLATSDLTNLKAVLAYPASYQGRLARLNLASFYDKQVLPAATADFEKATRGVYADRPKGARRRRRRYRGGAPPDFPAPDVSEAAKEDLETFLDQDDDAPLPQRKAPLEAAPAARPSTSQFASAALTTNPSRQFSFPTYDEFATVYADALRAPRISAAAAVNKSTADAKDRIAQKASATLADKLKKAIGAAETEVQQYDSRLTELADRTALDEKKEALKAMYDGKEADLRGITTAESWDASKKDYQALVASIPKAVKDYVAAVKQAEKKKVEVVATPGAPSVQGATPGAPSVQGATTRHDKILTEVPSFLKKVPGFIKEINGMKKGLASGMKELPKPEQYRGGCAIRVIADEFEDILNKLSPLIERRHEGLKKAFNDYKKETNDQPIYDSAIQRDDAKFAESKASIDTAVRELNARIETFFASVERMKGGARVLEKVYNLMDQIDLGVYALKRYTANVLGLKDSYDKILRMIEEVKDKRLETPAEWEEEKKSCPGQIETMRKVMNSPVVPIEFGNTATTYSNPLRGDTAPLPEAPAPVAEAAAPPRAEEPPPPGLPPPPSPGTSEPGTPSTTPVSDAPPAAPGVVSLYPPNPVSDNQILPGDAALGQSLRNLAFTPKKKGLNIKKPRSATVKAKNKGGRKSRKSTLKKRRGGK